MKIHEILGEMTSAGGIATVAGPLGSGDPKASIYASKKSKKIPNKTNNAAALKSLSTA